MIDAQIPKSAYEKIMHEYIYCGCNVQLSEKSPVLLVLMKAQWYLQFGFLVSENYIIISTPPLPLFFYFFRKTYLGQFTSTFG